MQKSYTRLDVNDDGDTISSTVVLNEDILLQYCIAYDANNYETREAIESVAIAHEDLQGAIQALHRRFDLHEDFTPQLLQYRRQMTEK